MRACGPHRDAGNLRRLSRDPAGIEAIVRGHGHVNHAAGLSGLPMPAGRAVIGGFHLTGPLIGDTVTAPGQLATDVIIPPPTGKPRTRRPVCTAPSPRTASAPPSSLRRDRRVTTAAALCAAGVARMWYTAARRQLTFGPRTRDFRPWTASLTRRIHEHICNAETGSWTRRTAWPRPGSHAGKAEKPDSRDVE